MGAQPCSVGPVPLPRNLTLAVAGALGYLAGTIPSADLASRAATGGRTDLRAVGTGNPGAANALAQLGTAWGMAVLVADVAKGALACAAGRTVAGPTGAHLAGTAAVVGHCFPAWNGFRGGKGVAVSLGQCLATLPGYVPADLAVAYAVGRWKGRTLPATFVASSAWVLASLVWWRRGWPNLWGPRPGPELPLAAAATTAVIALRFVTKPLPVPLPAAGSGRAR